MTVFCEYTWYFLLYSFIGWTMETVVMSFHAKKFVNRGFLNGPFCPIYAVGALVMVLMMQRLPANPFLVFIFGLLSTSVLEYLTGWLLEVIFQTKWWDYSEVRFNLQGRVCLKNSIYFGLLSVALMFFIHPTIQRLVGMLPASLLTFTAYGYLAYFAIDFSVTVTTILKLNNRLKAIHASMLTIKEKLDSIGFYSTAAIRERVEQFLEDFESENSLYSTIKALADHVMHTELENHILQKRIIKAFPNLKSLKYPEYLNTIKEKLVVKRSVEETTPEEYTEKDCRPVGDIHSQHD